MKFRKLMKIWAKEQQRNQLDPRLGEAENIKQPGHQ